MSSLTYDARGLATLETNALGQSVTTAYDTLGRPTVVTDVLGNATTTAYDALGRVTAVTQAGIGTTTTIYDVRGAVVGSIDPLGERTTFGYDDVGRQVAVTDPTGATVTTAYDPVGEVTATTDALGHTATLAYDAMGRVTSTTDALGNHTSTTYDTAGNVAASTDVLNHTTTYLYDIANRLTETIDALGNRSTMVLDALGNVTVRIDPLGNRTTMAYDREGRATQQTDTDGVTKWSYDLVGNRSVTIDPVGNRTTVIYDALNRETKIKAGVSELTTLLYDASGNLTKETDPDGYTTTWAYDTLGRETSRTDPLGNRNTTTYDVLSRVSTVTDRLGRQRLFSYDGAGRVTLETWKDSGGSTTSLITSTYDLAGNLLTAANGLGTYTMAYDAANRQTQTTGLFGVTVTSAYDAASNRTAVKDSFGGVLTSVYDAVNQLTTREFGGAGQTAFRYDRTYTTAGQYNVATRFSDLAGTTKVGETDYTWNSANDLTNVKHKNGTGTILQQGTYTYDAGHKVATEKWNGTPTGTYTYNATNQVTGDGTKNYSYDSNGNRIGGSYSTGTGNQLLKDGTFTYTYDAEGNLSSKSKGTSLEKWFYAYDNLNHLSSVRKTSNGTTNTLTVTYSYDALGMRVQEDKWQTGGSVVTTKHVYDGQQVLLDLTSGNALSNRNVWGDRADEILVRQDGGGTTSWAATDPQGSLRGVTDATGALVDSVTYDPYGNITAETNSAVGGNVLFQAMTSDRDTLLDYTPNREYAVATGRWLQEDPIMFRAGDANLYRMVGNNVLNATDPSGLKIVMFYNTYPGDDPADKLSPDKWQSWKRHMIKLDRELDQALLKVAQALRDDAVTGPQNILPQGFTMGEKDMYNRARSRIAGQFDKLRTNLQNGYAVAYRPTRKPDGSGKVRIYLTDTNRSWPMQAEVEVTRGQWQTKGYANSAYVISGLRTQTSVVAKNDKPIVNIAPVFLEGSETYQMATLGHELVHAFSKELAVGGVNAGSHDGYQEIRDAKGLGQDFIAVAIRSAFFIDYFLYDANIPTFGRNDFPKYTKEVMVEIGKIICTRSAAIEKGGGDTGLAQLFPQIPIQGER